MNKKVSLNKCLDLIKPGMSLMVGGFMGVGSPPLLLKALLDSERKDMVLACSDNALYMGDESKATGVALNVVAGQFRKYIASHIGLNIDF